MSVLKATKVDKSLLKKGFIKKNGDHHFYEFYYNNKFQFFTKTSHNNQDISESLINKMKNQCKLDKKDFMDLVNCPLSKEEYIKKLENGNHI